MKRVNTVKKKLLILLLALSLTGCAAEEEAPVVSEPAPERPVVEEPVIEPEPQPIVSTLVVCGDTMSHMPVTNDAWDAATGIYEYSRIMAAAEPYIAGADYAVANLETTLSGGPKYSGFPAFNSPDDLAAELKEVGFDLLLTANNHSLDKGNSGVCRTLDVLDEVGLAHVGTSRTEEEYGNNVVVADVGGISVAFLGYTYGTNGIPLPQSAPYAVNVYNNDYLTTLSDPNEEKLLDDLEAAKALGTDLVAVMIHWGVEYQTSANHFQQEMADFLFENGADLVLGGHAHVLQPMELRTIIRDGEEKQGFLCYSLGNFISAQNDPLTDTTVVVTLELTKDPVTGKTEVTDCVWQPMLMLDRESGPNRYELLDVYKELERTDLSDALREQLTQAAEDCRTILGTDFDAANR